MQLTFTIDNDDADQCPDKPWTAFVTVTSDDGRVSDSYGSGVGATVRAAIDDLFENFDGDDDNAWLPRSWFHGRHRGDDFVIVEGGVVQNDPSIPVYDLDVLDSDITDVAINEEITDLYKDMLHHPNQEAIQPWLAEVEKHAKKI